MKLRHIVPFSALCLMITNIDNVAGIEKTILEKENIKVTYKQDLSWTDMFLS